ncbi:hypothetical protein CY0110_18577 [Crocosphaera chwakensis CCY0110]|uniref:Uncharacterized protein n=1 Tax=Crocosphaera chwakensis CCY0110 TaxID=391612 RepID=A3IJ47_9CHRO|nr:hypothetical protein CY0110_18577 [Crocosphaera chwakensis CCY0110]
MGSKLPPNANTVSLNRFPVSETAFSSFKPASSNAENASALNTSAHL